METINNIAAAASKAVWGETKEEPVSGKSGNVSAGEPYDAGNIESQHETGTSKVLPTELGSKISLGREQQHTPQHEHGATYGVTGPEELIESSKPTRETSGYDQDTIGATKTYGLSSGVVGSERVIEESQPTRETSGYDNATTTETALRPKKVSSVDSYDNSASRHRDTTQAFEGAPKFDDENQETAPCKTQDSSATNRDLSKGQQDTRDPFDDTVDAQKSEARHNIDDADGGLDKDENPDKLDGPGPRPVAEVAKEHGGDAGKARSGENISSAGKETEEEEDGPQKVSHGEGTGEKVVRTTGLAADGGDFDVTKPGAGIEADRLLETKGVHRETPATKGAAGGEAAHDSHAPEHKEKKSLGEKIKEKLHRHGH